MKLLDKESYERNLKELMNTPIGGYQQKPMIKQPEPEPKVINEQPVEIHKTTVSTAPQPQPPPLSLQKTGNAQISLTRLGVLIGVGGTMFGYLYSTNPTIQLETNTMLSKLSTFVDNNPIIVGSVVVGVFLCALGLIFRR